MKARIVKRPLSLVLAALPTVALSAVRAQPPQADRPQTQPAQGQQPATQPPSSEQGPQPAEPEPWKPYRSKAWGVRLETEPPGYVNTLDKSGIKGLEELSWLEFGLENMTRYEFRDCDYGRPQLEHEDPFLMRSRVYLGVREIIDPFRFGIEFMDSRVFNSNYPPSNREKNEADFLQAFGELYFEDALGEGIPVSFRFGRMCLEYVDRRQVGRNRWRVGVNAFDGFRLRLGQPSAKWQFDFFAVMPVERRQSRLDRSDEERWFYGLVGAWRGWSQYVTLEPYYFILDEDIKDPNRDDREIHTIGLHAYGPIGRTRFDYDADVAFQFGDDGPRDHCAFAMYGEVGYIFRHAWKPRLSFSTMYASGDRDPDDNRSERYDRLFQPGHPYSMQDYWNWQNVINPELRLSLRPLDTLRIDTGYGAFWLASDNDAWTRPGRRDPTGHSGDFVGQQIDLRIRWQLDPRIEIETGYSHFFAGDFPHNTGEG
ncbi:MAG: alginate export family protein, partial [Phycisphaerales bacterium]